MAVNSSVYCTHTRTLLINTPCHTNRTEPCKCTDKDKNTNIKPQSKVITESEKLVMRLLNCITPISLINYKKTFPFSKWLFGLFVFPAVTSSQLYFFSILFCYQVFFWYLIIIFSCSKCKVLLQMYPIYSYCISIHY